MTRHNLFMVFDVESIGIHGEGFAVGYVVVDATGALQDEGMQSCPIPSANGAAAGREWVLQNVPGLHPLLPDPYTLRRWFWSRWLWHKDRGAVLVADCAWPVEARFLAACVDDDHEAREWQGPYPLHDLASVLLALGRDPLATNERLPDELPAHNPLCDARQSARLLIDALRACDERTAA